VLVVYIDGACKPVNPGGTASYGLVVKFHQTGEVLYQEAKIVGSGPFMSNNVAEYSALLAFLKWLVAYERGRSCGT
jgi:ribonuclease HI